MIFCNETEDKKLCDPFAKFDFKMVVVMVFFGVVTGVGLGFFSAEHLLKCKFNFYNVSYTTPKGGSSAEKVLQY